MSSDQRAGPSAEDRPGAEFGDRKPTPAEVVAAWPDHEAEQAYRAKLCAEAFEAGREHMARQAGLLEEARADAARADAGSDAEVREQFAQVAEAARAGLEERRWGPGGRAHFGDPRPGDFPGRNPRPEPEPEQEAQAG